MSLGRLAEVTTDNPAAGMGPRFDLHNTGLIYF